MTVWDLNVGILLAIWSFSIWQSLGCANKQEDKWFGRVCLKIHWWVEEWSKEVKGGRVEEDSRNLRNFELGYYGFWKHCVGVLDKRFLRCWSSHSFGARIFYSWLDCATVLRLVSIPSQRSLRVINVVTCVDSSEVLTHQSPGDPSYKVVQILLFF